MRLLPAGETFVSDFGGRKSSIPARERDEPWKLLMLALTSAFRNTGVDTGVKNLAGPPMVATARVAAPTEARSIVSKVVRRKWAEVKCWENARNSVCDG